MYLTSINKVNCIDIYKGVYGTSSIGNLKIYQLITIGDSQNPYEDLPLIPSLVLDTDCVSVKSMQGRISREDYGINTTQLWRVTINGDVSSEKLILNNYAFITWNNQVIKGVISNVERKLTNRYYLYIDTSVTVPFTP